MWNAIDVDHRRTDSSADLHVAVRAALARRGRVNRPSEGGRAANNLPLGRPTRVWVPHADC
jgi:hypothetical protein